MSTIPNNYGQYGAGPWGVPVVARQILGPASAQTGNVDQYQLVDIYQDGTEVVLAGVVWSVSDGASISSTGQVTFLAPTSVTITAVAGDGASYTLDVNVGSGQPTSLTISGPLMIGVAQSIQYVALAEYGNGAVTDVTKFCVWQSNSTNLAVASTGQATGIRVTPLNLQAQFVPTITASFSGLSKSLPVTVTAQASLPVAPLIPFYRSCRTQILQNYFDIADQRMREEPYTIDAQLLNTAAVVLDDSEMRIGREIASRLLATCPSGIDNRGVYYAVKLPKDFPLIAGQTLLTQVTGTKGSKTVSVNPYDDRLPVPSGYDVEESVAMTAPVLFDVTGTGDSDTQVWNPYALGPFTLATPNVLTFWAEGVGGNAMDLDIFVQGIEYPKSVWADQQEGSSETLTSSGEGCFTSVRAWQDISSIVVRGLPAGVRLRCWQMPFTVPAVPDKARPFTHSAFRDEVFARYWSVNSDESLLEELFMMDNYSGLEPIQSYRMTQNLNSVSIEPFTWGMVGASGTSLVYWDRREPMPAQMGSTALKVEPPYGVDVRRDINVPGPMRSARIHPVSYRNAANVVQWRYVVMNPDGTYQVLLPDGTLTAYTGAAGWQTGDPVAVSMPLNEIGTYVITLECRTATSGILGDSAIYGNFATPVANTYDLSSVAAAIKGLAYDFLGRLWIWTGSEAVALKPLYDGYILDPASLTLYLTSEYDSVTFQ